MFGRAIKRMPWKFQACVEACDCTPNITRTACVVAGVTSQAQCANNYMEAAQKISSSSNGVAASARQSSSASNYHPMNTGRPNNYSCANDFNQKVSTSSLNFKGVPQ